MNDTTKKLLDVDLDAVVEAGNITHKAKKRKAILFTAVGLLLALCAFLAFWGISVARTRSIYQTAVTALDQKNYSEACQLFQSIIDYKDCEQRVFELEYIQSDEYSVLKDSMIDSMSDSGFEAEIYYDFNTHAIVQKTNTKDLTEKDFVNITPSFFAAWANTLQAMDDTSEALYSVLDGSEYDIGAILRVYDETGTYLIYESTNGSGTFCCIDYDATKKAMYETVYKEMKQLVDSNNYEDAYNYWLELAGFYSDAYNDLQDYANYALALEQYHTTGTVPLKSMLDRLENVSPEFKDTQRYIDEISAIKNSIEGKYIKNDGVYICTLTIEDNQITWDFKPEEESEGVVGDIEMFNASMYNASASIENYVLEDGKVSNIIPDVISGVFLDEEAIEINFTPNGITIDGVGNTNYEYIGDYQLAVDKN